MLMIRVLWILRKSQNRLSQYHLEIQLDLETSGKCTLMSFISCFIDHFRCVSDFSQIPRRNFLWFSPFFVHCFFCFSYFHRLSIGIKLCAILQWCSELHPFPAMWSSWILGAIPSTRSLLDSSASKIHVNLDLWLCIRATGHSMLAAICPFTR